MRTKKELLAIRNELKDLIKKKKSECSTEAQENNAVNEARHQINLKYGKGWRDELKMRNFEKSEFKIDRYDENEEFKTDRFF